MAKKTPLISSRQRKVLIRTFTTVIENIRDVDAVRAEKWAKGLAKAVPVIFAEDPQKVVRAIKSYGENPPVKPPSKVSVICPQVGESFTLVISASAIRRCRLIQIGFQPSFAAVRQKIGEKGCAAPPAGYLKIFKARYPHATGPIGVAVAVSSPPPPPQGFGQFPSISGLGVESFHLFHNQVSLGPEWLWLVVDV